MYTKKKQELEQHKDDQGREESFMDIDRMINEGLGGGRVTFDNGWIEESTVHTMNNPEEIDE